MSTVKAIPETTANGFLLLEQLSLAGWSVAIMRAPGGVAIYLYGLGRPHIEMSGASVAELAPWLFETALYFDRRAA